MGRERLFYEARALCFRFEFCAPRNALSPLFSLRGLIKARGIACCCRRDQVLCFIYSEIDKSLLSQSFVKFINQNVENEVLMRIVYFC